MDALKRRAGRYTKKLENNSPQIAANFRSNYEVAKTAGISGIHSTLPQGTAVTLLSLKKASVFRRFRRCTGNIRIFSHNPLKTQF
ncbi:hypothetical protein [Acutalibacter muris]|jgi:hypothetical protein|uniref:hypothetical protein n=1 Tax=Acutalibacter muris TaxID=1796620 RepID=UPI00272E7F88|nr:hypothetical protein [Acutalibacter muris]